MRKEQSAKFWYFNRFNLFKVLSPEEKMLLDSKLILKSYRAGDILFLRGDQERNIYFLRSGKAMLYRYSQHDNNFLVEIARPGDLFGGLAWMQNSECDFAQVLSDTLLCYLDVQKWEEYIGAHPNISANLLKWMGGEITSLEKELESIMVHGAP